jgi:hypothetical protein
MGGGVQYTCLIGSRELIFVPYALISFNKWIKTGNIPAKTTLVERKSLRNFFVIANEAVNYH